MEVCDIFFFSRFCRTGILLNFGQLEKSLQLQKNMIINKLLSFAHSFNQVFSSRVIVILLQKYNLLCHTEIVKMVIIIIFSLYYIGEVMVLFSLLHDLSEQCLTTICPPS